jgi:UDP-3-O-[3-hydroxymyristoyl] glucosamine N-acyltransferase
MKLPKEFSLAEIAALVGGKVEGDATTRVDSVALSPLEAGKGDLALFFEPKYISQIDKCKASAVLVSEGVATNLPRIIVKRPLVSLQKMLTAVQPKRYVAEKGVHPSAFVDPTAQLGADVAIGPQAVIGPKTKIGARTKIGAGCLIGGEVVIGEDCIFHQGAKIADYVKVGNRVILQQGASLGADGFSYVTERPSNMELRMGGVFKLSDEPNPLLKIPNIGTVIIEDDVEIGSNACVDRATMGATVIGAGSKIDDLVMIAHNCRLGKEVIIAGHTAVAGSCTLGDRVILAGQVGLKDHVRLGKDVILQGQCGARNDIEDGAVMVGSPAEPVKDFFVMYAHVRKLPKMAADFRTLKKKIDELERVFGQQQLEPAKAK